MSGLYNFIPSYLGMEGVISISLRKGWHYTGDIEQPLEDLAAYKLGHPAGRDNPIVGAAQISENVFISIMLFVLEKVNGIDISYIKFEEKCMPYKGKHLDTIPKRIAAELYDEFKALLGESN